MCCAWPARKERNALRRCCPARRACCDCAGRLRAGNLTSVRKALTAVRRVLYACLARRNGQATGIIVPGVGHSSTTAMLDARWKDAIRAALARGVPLSASVLVCSGCLRDLTERSAWRGWGYARGDARSGSREPGLPAEASAKAGVESPEAARLKFLACRLELAVAATPVAFASKGVPDGTQVYFTDFGHRHRWSRPRRRSPPTASPSPQPSRTVSVSGAQFHPEKSGDAGLRIFRNWLTHVPETLVIWTLVQVLGRDAPVQTDHRLPRRPRRTPW